MSVGNLYKPCLLLRKSKNYNTDYSFQLRTEDQSPGARDRKVLY